MTQLRIARMLLASALLSNTLVAQCAPFAYLTTPSNTLVVVDVSSNAVVRTLAVGTTPFSATISPSGLRVYVSNFDDNTISVVDASLNVIAATIPIADGPQGLIVNPAGTRLYVASSRGNALSTIDTATNAVISTLVTLPHAAEVIINAAGTRLYVAVDQAIAVVDPATNAVLSTIQIGNSTEVVGMSLSLDGTRLYVWDLATSQIVVVNTVTDAVVIRIQLLPSSPAIRGTAVNPVNGLVYASNGSKVAVINPATNTIIATVSLGTSAGSFSSVNGIGVTADGKRAVAATGSGAVQFDTATLSLFPLIPGTVRALDHFIGPGAVVPPPPVVPLVVPALGSWNLVLLSFFLVLITMLLGWRAPQVDSKLKRNIAWRSRS